MRRKVKLTLAVIRDRGRINGARYNVPVSHLLFQLRRLHLLLGIHRKEMALF